MPSSILEPLHRFHSYCARFPSEIAETAISKYVKAGESTYDPFCGSGTTLVAALAQGRPAIGSDIDVLAGMLTEVKCNPKPIEHYDPWRQAFATRLERDFGEISRKWTPPKPFVPGSVLKIGKLALPIPAFPELPYWFPPQLTAALAAIANAAHETDDPHLERVALVSLSASIISKWPNTLSYAMDVDHTRPHRRLRRFTLSQALVVYLGRLNRTITSLGDLYRVYQDNGQTANHPVRARVVCPHDARTFPSDLEPGSQSLVVTSPPYFNAVDYPRAHRLSVCWMNGFSTPDLVSRKNYVGLHYATAFDVDNWLKERSIVRRMIPSPIRESESLTRKLCGFYDDLEKVLANTITALRPGGHAVFVIANNVIKGTRIASHRILAELAQGIGFAVISSNARPIKSVRRRFPVGPFGFDGPMTHEYLLVLRKPAPRRA